MPLIPAVEKKPEVRTVSFPLERSLESDLREYMKLVNAPNQAYVFNMALRYLFSHDKDFLKQKEQPKPVVLAAAR